MTNIHSLATAVVTQASDGRGTEHIAYMTVPEVARALRISESLCRRLIASGQIEHRRLGRIIRVPVSAINGAG
jgi:excisionase family DNA binding protein